MSLKVIDHYPHIFESNVPRNCPIKIQFGTGILPQSVVYTHFSVNDAATYISVPGTLGVEYVSGVPTIAIFTPDINMTQNNKYRVFIYGKPNSIIDQDGEQLESTYSFEFTTGTGLIPSGVSIPGIPSGTYYEDTTSGEVPSESSSDINSLSILEIYPLHQQPNVATNLSQIDIHFNMPITSTLEELDELVNLDIKDVLY